MVTQLNGEVFPTSVAKRKKFFKIVQTNGLSVKENANASECTALRITRCSHSLSATYLRLFILGDLWINSLVNV